MFEEGQKLSHDFKAPDFVETKPKGDFRFPNPAEIQTLSLEEMENIWKTNDIMLLEATQDKEIPYFGFHGAIKSSLDHIREQTKDGHVTIQLTTFFSKPENNRVFLNSLYINANYSLSYGFYEAAGFQRNSGPKVIKNDEELLGAGLIVVNLQEQDRNISKKDPDTYKQAWPFPDIEDPSAVGQRGFLELNKASSSRIVRIITSEDLCGYPASSRQLNKDYNSMPKEDQNAQRKWGEVYYTDKFLMQKAVLETLKSLQVI